MQVFFALVMAATAITQSSNFTSDSVKAKAATASIFSIIDRKSKIDLSDELGLTLESVKGEIEPHHLSFKYPSRPDIHIFRDLSVVIHSGKVMDKRYVLSEEKIAENQRKDDSNLHEMTLFSFRLWP